MALKLVSPVLALGLAGLCCLTVPVRAAEPQTVVVASFGSLWQDALEKAFLPFERENNVQVRFTAGSSADNVARAVADKRFCHRIGLGDPNVSFTYCAFMMLGGGKPDDVPAGTKRLAAIRGCIDSLDTSAAKTIDKVQLGETDIGVLAHQLVVTMAQQNVPVKFVSPKEGTILQFTTAEVVKNAPHPQLAQQIVNEMLSPRVQETLVRTFSVSPVNTGVTVPPEVIAAGAPDPAHMDRYVAIDAGAICRIGGNTSRRPSGRWRSSGRRAAEQRDDGRIGPDRRAISSPRRDRQSYGGLAVVQDVLLGIERDKVLTILGPSGCGQDDHAEDDRGVRAAGHRERLGVGRR